MNLSRVNAVVNGNIDSVMARRGTVSRQTDKAVSSLKQRMQLLSAIGSAEAVSVWDREVYMPKGAIDGKANALGLTSEHAHKIFTNSAVDRALKVVEESGDIPYLSLAEEVMIEQVRENYDDSRKLPASFVREQVEVVTKAQQAWQEAKKKNDFSIFAPHLKKVVELAKREAAYKKPELSPYDVMLDDHEKGLTAGQLNQIFTPLRDSTVTLLREIQAKGIQRPDNVIGKRYVKPTQLRVAKDLLKVIGYDFKTGRLDESAHPFTIPIGPGDVRITTRILSQNPFSNIGSAVHEGGHGIHFQQINQKLREVSLADSPSLGIAESQSRFYENLIGRNRQFWGFYYPKLQKAFPSQLRDVPFDDFYLDMNYVKPGLVRTESDELTYNLHIILRFEIEQALIKGELQVDDLPEVWNQKMEEYLGVRPNTDSEGVLQDVHWSHGSFGYFPTYTLGNLISPQIHAAAEKDLGNLDRLKRKGEIAPITEWLGQKVHWYGEILKPAEVVQASTGEYLNPEYSSSYMRSKFAEIYGL